MKEPSQAGKQKFYAEMHPRWKEIATMLAADRPPDWKGYRFEARIECGANPKKFTIKCNFCDRLSNRQRGGTQREIVDKLAELYLAYLDFSATLTWRAVIIKQIWRSKSKSWDFETNWEY